MSKTRENVSTTNALFMWPKIDKPYVYFTELEYRGEDFSLPYNRTLAYSIGRYAEGVMRTDRAEGEKHSE